MNLAFSLPRDKELCENNPLQPFKIVSLREVLDFAATNYMNLANSLLRLNQSFDKAIEQGLGDTAPIAPSDDVKETMNSIHKDLVVLGLSMSAISAKRLLKSATCQGTHAEIRRLAEELHRRILDELDDRRALLFPSTRTNYYKMQGTFLGEELIDKFQELTRDAVEAGNCYALARYTACVFHLARLLEGSIQKLATDINATKDGLPLDVKNEEWFQIEISIGKVINPWTKGEKKTQYLKVLSSLSALRGGWRNPTMHPAEWYSEEEAEALMKFAKQFLVDFSKLPPP